MAVCSYVVRTDPGARASVARLLGEMDGCEVVPALDADLVLAVTEAPDLEAEAELRKRIERAPGVAGVVLAFGDVDPQGADPFGPARGRRGRRPPRQDAGVPGADLRTEGARRGPASPADGRLR